MLAGVVEPSKIDSVVLRLDSLASCREAAQSVIGRYKSIDILILNAAVLQPTRQLTEDGLEMMIGVNHFGTFLFGNLLVPLLQRAVKKRGSARFVIVGSDGHKDGKLKLDDYNWESRTKAFGDGMQAYFDSKQCSCLYTTELARKLAESGILVTCLNPGAIATDLARNSKKIQFAMKYFLGPFLKTIPQGAATTVYCAVSPLDQHAHGAYFHNSQLSSMAPGGCDANLAAQLWEETERVTGYSWRPQPTEKKASKSKRGNKKNSSRGE